MAKKKGNKNQRKKSSANRKKSLTYTLISLGFILLTFIWHWLFIIPAVVFLYLGRKYLLE